MIYLGNIREIKDDMENWLIVRNVKSLPKHTVWVPDLSPSKELFYRYRQAANAGQYNKKWFDENYVDKFLVDMIKDPESIKLLDSLYQQSFNKDIRLACFCSDENTCHRSIVGGMLLGAGANITCSNDYAKYWTRFQELSRELSGQKSVQSTRAQAKPARDIPEVPDMKSDSVSMEK
jgi:uncharacterized protein YeaO (DUF488 family)